LQKSAPKIHAKNVWKSSRVDFEEDKFDLPLNSI
jgi:hypothetical protein